MSSPSHTAEFWALKAHALLLPTPLASPGAEPFAKNETEHPEKDLEESARADDLRKLLIEHDLKVTWTPELHKLHRDAHRDAYYAHVPNADKAPTGPIEYSGLRHPLSGEKLGIPQTTDKDAWNAFREGLDKTLAKADQSAEQKYKALWRALINPEHDVLDLLDLAKRPGHPIFNDHSIIARRSAASALIGARYGGTKAALLCLHTGPVQGFIAHARRTHDLSLGSYIIAYLSFQAIQSLADRWGPDAILYPDLATLALYDYTGGDLKRAQQALRASLPNRFMAIVADYDADESAKVAAKAVGDCWKKIADSVREKFVEIDSSLNLGDFFDPQIADHLQIDATIRPWARTENSDSGYESGFKDTRKDLTAQRRILTALPITAPKFGDRPAYKCTQCGDREQLGSGKSFWAKLRGALEKSFSGKPECADPSNEVIDESIDLRDGEALCAVCLTKRFANRWYFGDPKQHLGLNWKKTDKDRLLLRFPSVASIASAPLRYALEQNRSTIDLSTWSKAVKSCHDQLHFTPPGNLLPGLGGPERTQTHLDFDGTWYYETSYEPETALRDHDLNPQSEESKAKVEKLKGPLLEARRRFKEALKGLSSGVHVTPYYAVIVLDVDGMGKWLDGDHHNSLKRQDFHPTIDSGDKKRTITPALHREISRRQSLLASNPLYKIVEHNHLGRVIYSGGDDVLAFVPLDTLWRCLDELRRCFCSTKGLGSKVTLSAGVAISHWRAPLSRALSLARKAEGKAKDSGRNRLVLTVDRRSGSELELTVAWPLIERLCDLSVLADLDEDRGTTGDNSDATDRPRKIRLNTLETLERELETLCHFENPALAAEAIRSRVALHLTGTRYSEIKRPGLLLKKLLEAGVEKTKTGEILVILPGDPPQEPQKEPQKEPKKEPIPFAPLVPLLQLLRFLARERDPAIANSSQLTKEVT